MSNNALRRRPKSPQELVSIRPADASDLGPPSIEQLCGAAGFLVISRRIGEGIVIEVAGHLIQIKLMDLKRSCTKIGIRATRDALVLRQEIYERNQKEQYESDHDLSAAGGTDDEVPASGDQPQLSAK